MARETDYLEATAAREWREGAGLSRRELAERTGYSERTIAAYEVGEYGPGRPVPERAYLTYRLACVTVALDAYFDWKVARVQVGSVTIERVIVA